MCNSSSSPATVFGDARRELGEDRLRRRLADEGGEPNDTTLAIKHRGRDPTAPRPARATPPALYERREAFIREVLDLGKKSDPVAHEQALEQLTAKYVV